MKKKSTPIMLLLLSACTEILHAESSILVSEEKVKHLAEAKTIPLTEDEKKSLNKNASTVKFKNKLAKIKDTKIKINKQNKGYRYTVRGKTYNVIPSSEGFKQVGVASWYGPGFHGKKTANGEVYNQFAMTAAHKTLPLGTYVVVKNPDNGKSIKVKINDRGPFARGRVIDLSKAAAKKIGLLNQGHGKVYIVATDR